jgi:hypothetical protein
LNLNILNINTMGKNDKKDELDKFDPEGIEEFTQKSMG